MNYQSLGEYIQNKPEFANWLANGNDQEIADALNAKTLTIVKSVSRSDFTIWAASTGMRAVIQDHADNAQSPLRSSALSLLDFLRGAATALDLSQASTSSLLDAWVGAGALSVANKLSLLALAEVTSSVAEEQFGQTISNVDVAISLGRVGMRT
jgi:hypothetical protein